MEKTADRRGPTWRDVARGRLPWETFRRRARILERIRAMLRDRGFTEVDPPAAAPYPNLDPHIYPVAVSNPAGRASRLYLHTSPELSMKKLLAAGSGNIFFLGKVFRDREGSPLHAPEFTMLEWYRVGEGPERLMADVEDLCRALARDLHGRESLPPPHASVPLAGPWPRWELADAFRDLLGADMGDAGALRASLAARGGRPGPDETWEDLFFRACLDVVEPALRLRGAVFVTGFPSSLAAMARRRPEAPALCDRFEGYVGGIELVNGYAELTDPVEQEARLREYAAAHRRRTGVDLPVDPEFLAALRHGLPPCAGAALGVDRLAMLLLGKDDIADVTIR